MRSEVTIGAREMLAHVPSGRDTVNYYGHKSLRSADVAPNDGIQGLGRPALGWIVLHKQQEYRPPQSRNHLHQDACG